MSNERINRISPVVDHLFPDKSEQEKEELTRELRPYFRLLCTIINELDENVMRVLDSPDSGKTGRI